MKKSIFWILLLFLLLIGIESLSLLGLFLLKRIKNDYYKPFSYTLWQEQRDTLKNLLAGENTYIAYSPSLGWTIKPNGSSGTLYRANSRGIRSDQEYSLLPPKGKIRIEAFGDSFTHAENVGNSDMWTAKLSSFDSRFEVLNFGTPGYGLDQSFLRYQEDGTPFKPDIVLIGFIAPDIYRGTNIFRGFMNIGSLPLGKPRFILKNNELVLFKNPLPKVEDYEFLLNNERSVLRKLLSMDSRAKRLHYKSRYDFLHSVRLFKVLKPKIFSLFDKNDPYLWNGVYNTQSEAYRITAKLFDEFYASALQNGSLPVIVLFPIEEDFDRHAKGKEKSYAVLLHEFEKKGYRAIDLMDYFLSKNSPDPVREFYSGHFSVRGNQVAAEGIYSYLKDQDLL